MSRRDAARLLGSIRALRPAAPWILLDTAALSAWLARLERWETRYHIPLAVQDEMRALVPLLRRGISSPLRPPPPAWVVTTDASGWGWGATISRGSYQHELTSHGVFSPSERTAPACIREMYAVTYALAAFRETIGGDSVLVRSDSTVVVTSLQAKRARARDLVSPLRKIREIIPTTVEIYSSHIPGVLNVHADELSRIPEPTTGVHWVRRSVFVHACRTLDVWPEVDLFGSSTFHQLRPFVSARRDPSAIANNSFTLDWSVWRVAWANPPFGLLPRTLAHFRSCAEASTREFSIILVTPRHIAQSWAVSLPLLALRWFDLPDNATVFPPPEALVGRWTLRVWILSASRARQ